jgi:lysophospholipase L1-like esterase
MTLGKQIAGRRARWVAAGCAVLLMLGIAAEALLRARSSVEGVGHADGSGDALLPVMQQIKIQEAAGQVTYAFDRDFGALMAPGRTDVIDTPQYTYTLRTDHAGFPNREPWPERIDVAVLGDSLLIGAGLGFDGQFTTLLSNRLGGKTVLNLGVPGAGTEQQLRVYRKFAAPLRPRFVVATIWITWDVDNSLQFNRWLAEKSTMDFTEYRMTFGDTHPASTNAGPSSLERLGTALRGCLSKSYLLKAIYLRVKAPSPSDPHVERAALPSGDTILLAVRDEDRLAMGLERPGAPDASEVFFKPLVQLRNEVEAQGGKFVLLLVPSKEELYAAESFPDVLRSWREAKVGFAAQQLPVLDLYPVLRQQGQDRPIFFSLDAHLNRAGNQAVADALAQWISRGDLPATR